MWLKNRRPEVSKMLTYSALNYLKHHFKSQRVFNKCLRILRNCSTQSTQSQEEVFKESGASVVEPRVLKVAIIGTPNSGKSTLINKIVDRRVFPMSKKVHTTLCRARAVHVEGSTQLIFLDTPGLVSVSESQKYKLGHQFLTDGEDAIEEADIIGVVHDLSNPYTRNRLDSKVLRLLHLHQSKESFLILNKIDTMKSKRGLLNISDALTGGKLWNSKVQRPTSKLSEGAVQDLIKSKPYWEAFSDVFMVSALLGNGTPDIKSYLLHAAHPGDWIFPCHVFTDQKPLQMIEETVRSKLLEYLPNEVPYNLGIELEYLDLDKEDEIVAVVLVSCKAARLERLVLGSGGHRIKLIAREAEQALVDSFLTNVHLRLVVVRENSQAAVKDA